MSSTPLTSPRKTQKETIGDQADKTKEHVWVYSEPSPKDGPIGKDPDGRKTGIWKAPYVGNNPQELWVFQKGKEPASLEGSKHIHGVWGYKPGALEFDCPADDMWFYPPKTEIPSYFTVRGVWMLPLVKRDASAISPGQAGFVNLVKSPKVNKLDVGGTWRMLYQADKQTPKSKTPSKKKKKEKAVAPPTSLPFDADDEKPKPINIKVKDWRGNEIPLSVFPEDTVDDIKNKVQEKEGIPKEIQRLRFQDKPLTNPKKSVRDCGIKDGSVLDLEGMQIYVKTPDDKTLTLDVDPRDTINNVKVQLVEQTKIPKDQQKLFFQNNELTDNRKTLTDAGIEHKSTLHLEGMKIFVKDPAGRTFPLKVNPKDTINDIKNKIVDQEGIPKDQQRLLYQSKPLNDPKSTLQDLGIPDGATIDLEGMQIYVKTPDGKKHLLDVDPNDTIKNLKMQIQDELKIPKENQRLFYNSEPLSNDKKTLSGLGIPHKATLELEGMQIIVNAPDGKKHTLDVDPNDTIDNVKTKLAKKTGIPKDQQKLDYRGKELDDDNKTLQDLNIPHKAEIDLSQKMKIYVKDQTTGKTFTLQDLKPTDSINDIQTKIQKQEGIPKNQQRLVYQNVPLYETPLKSLQDCGIKNEATLELEGMQITVNTPDGKKVTLNVKPDDTIDSVKDQMVNKSGIPKDDQRLVYNGRELKDNNKTLADNKIPHKAVLDLDGMKIHVKDQSSGKKFTLPKVKSTDAIDDVQTMIQKQEGIPKDQQRLIYNGTPLYETPSKTLADCGIKNDATLELEAMQITVNTPDGKKVTLDVTPNDTIDDVKARLAVKTGLPKDVQHLLYNDKELKDNKKTLGDLKIPNKATMDLHGMKIYVKDPKSRKTFALPNVLPTNTVDQIKKRIHKEQGIPIDQQRLKFGSKSMDTPTSTLQSYGVKHESTLELEPMQITVTTPDGKKVNLEVDPNDTIDSVKQQVTDKVGVPKDEQKLIYNGKELDDDTKTLADNNIPHKANLDLDGMKIHVKRPNGKTFTLSDVKPTDTIDKIKQKIQKQEGIPKDQQRLAFAGKPLNADSKTLADCGVKDGSTLDLEGMQITVTTSKGKKITLDVTPNDTIDDVKNQVLEKENIPKDEQRLLFEGTELDKDNKTLADYKIPHKANLDLEGMQVCIEDYTGKKYMLDVQPSDTVEDVKNKIHIKRKIPKDQQRLLFLGKELDDNKTLKGSGIKHKDILKLVGMDVTVNTPDGKKIPLTVLPTETVADIKAKITKKEKIPKEKQNLSFEGKDLKDDKATAADIGIKHGSELDLAAEPEVASVTVNVKTVDGKIIPLEVKLSDTVDSVKDKVHAKEGIPKKRQTLTFNGKELKDSKKLETYKIKNGSTLNLEQMRVYIKHYNGNMFPLNVEVDDSVDSLKAKIQEKDGMPVDEQKLMYEGKRLENGKTLEDYGVKHKTTIFIVEPPNTAKEEPTEEDELAVPEFRVDVGPYQNAFDFEQGTVPKKSGARKKQGNNLLGLYKSNKITDPEALRTKGQTTTEES